MDFHRLVLFGALGMVLLLVASLAGARSREISKPQASPGAITSCFFAIGVVQLCHPEGSASDTPHHQLKPQPRRLHKHQSLSPKPCPALGEWWFIPIWFGRDRYPRRRPKKTQNCSHILYLWMSLIPLVLLNDSGQIFSLIQSRLWCEDMTPRIITPSSNPLRAMFGFPWRDSVSINLT